MRRLRREAGQDIAEILASPKLMRFQWPYDFLARYETVLARTIDWTPLDFENRSVLEIGCGPMLGWGPLALFLGAKRYVAIEPAWDPKVLRHRLVIERYLLRMWKDQVALYGPKMTFDAFMQAIEQRSTVVTAPLLDADLDGEFDIVLSNSCLEHIFPLSDSLKRLAGLSAPNSRFLHLVDFGNHRPTRNPFDGIYSLDPEDYLRRHGKQINLLRATDMQGLFAEAGLAARLVPYYSFRDFHSEPITAHWREHYSDADLFLKTALIVSDP